MVSVTTRPNRRHRACRLRSWNFWVPLLHERMVGCSYSRRSPGLVGRRPPTCSHRIARGSINTAIRRSVGDVSAPAADDPELANGELDLPNPHTADLIARVLPWDHGTLDRAIDQFFKQVERTGRRQ